MKTVNVSIWAILKIILVPLFLYLIWVNRDLVFVIFIAFILMSSLQPMVSYLETKRRIPRKFASLVVIVFAVGAISLLVGTIVPPIVSETTLFLEKLPDILKVVSPPITKYVRIEEITKYVPDLANQIVSLVSNIFSNTLLIILSLFISYYFLANEVQVEEKVVRLLGRHMPEQRAQNYLRIVRAAELRLAAWFWGELTLMFAVGLFSYIGFSLIGLKYSLPLAVLAGILEAVPNIGPIFTAVVATLIGFGQSSVLGFGSLAVSFIVQQAENYILVPYIMRRAVGLNPIITMLSIILGLRIAGPLGALLAIPIYVFVESIYTEHFQNTEE